MVYIIITSPRIRIYMRIRNVADRNQVDVSGNNNTLAAIALVEKDKSLFAYNNYCKRKNQKCMRVSAQTNKQR